MKKKIKDNSNKYNVYIIYNNYFVFFMIWIFGNLKTFYENN